MTAAVSIITTTLGSITNTVFGGLIGLFVALGVIGGIVSIFRR